MSQINIANKSTVELEIIKQYDLVICEEVVINLHFKNNNFFSWKGGEESKDIKNFKLLSTELIKLEVVTRYSKILVIGGGAFTDLVGFTLSTIYRGISWSVIPTTLLGMVDAAIGGKTAINTEQGKNLIGSFHFPEIIYLVEDFLSTLPSNEFDSGKGEILKYALLSKGVYKAIFENESLIEIVKKCATFKLEITQADPFEKEDKRIQLNLGHTLGHGIEKYLNCTHGEAVTWGIAQIATMYSSDMRQTIFKISEQLKLEVPKFKVNFNEISKFVKKDKKNNSNAVKLIVPASIGEFQLLEVSIDKLAERFEQCL